MFFPCEPRSARRIGKPALQGHAALALLSAACLIWPTAINAALITGEASGKILAAGTDKVMILAPTGETIWEYPAKLVHDVWMLPSGNVLFADGESVTEVTPGKRVVFRYQSSVQEGGGTYSCQRLADGHTLIGENSTGTLLEVDAAGKAVFSLPIKPSQAGQHHNLRMVRKLENGNYLVCLSGAKLVRECTPAGQVVWESRQPGGVAFAALRTPAGTTLVSSLDQIVEYDAHGEKKWEFTIHDLPGITLRNLTGMHLRPNGNLVVGCYSAYQNGQGCGLFEITREKQLVWRYQNPKGASSMMGVQLLDAEGKAGPCLR